MNENYCPGSRRDCRIGFFRIDIKGHRIYVDQDGAGPFVQCGIGGCNKAERSRNDFIPLSKTQSTNTQMQSAGSRINCPGMTGAAVVGDRPLEFGQLWAKAQPAAAENANRRGNFGLAYIRLRQRDSHRYSLFEGATRPDGTGRLVRRASPSGTLASA